jgi:hypothetical protein
VRKGMLCQEMALLLGELWLLTTHRNGQSGGAPGLKQHSALQQKTPICKEKGTVSDTTPNRLLGRTMTAAYLSTDSQGVACRIDRAVGAAKGAAQDELVLVDSVVVAHLFQRLLLGKVYATRKCDISCFFLDDRDFSAMLHTGTVQILDTGHPGWHQATPLPALLDFELRRRNCT